MNTIVKNCINFIHRLPEKSSQFIFAKHNFTDWRMLKDFKKRQYVKKYGKERLRINTLRKNTVLPRELQMFADKEIDELPRASSIVQLNNRCAITSRSRGTVLFFKVSRIVFRDLADYNRLAGVQRAMW